MSRIRALLALVLALTAAVVIAACGGGGGNDEDPQQVLNETFSNSIQSGTFDLDFKIETEGGEDPGSLEAKVGGPFQGRGTDFPQFDIDVSLKAESSSQSVSGTGGLTSTGDKAFINFQGTEYAVDQELFDRYVSTYTKLQERSGSQDQGPLAALGIDPGTWMTDLKNEGTEDVQGTESIHISGEADVPKFVDDLKAIAKQVGSAAGQINPDQLDQLKDTVESASFDVFTGVDDKVLRKLEATLDLKPPAGTSGAPDSLSVELELTFGDVNEPQSVEAPSGAQPLSALLRQLNIDPGQLGSSLRGGLQSGGARPETGGSTTAPSNDQTEAYLNCLSQAKGQAELEKCAELLGQ